MKLEAKQKVIVQVYLGRTFGTMIGSNDGLIGSILNSGEYIDVPHGNARVISAEVERDANGRNV